MKQYRQGDVLIERVENLPKKSKGKHTRTNRMVLAEGEVTGHAHVLLVDDADWWKDDKDQFVSFASPATVVHEEHRTLHLPAGTYRISRQREYSPEAIRNVTD